MAKDADKNVGKLQLNAGEVVVFIGTCSNWVPIALDWIAVTNQRLLAGSNIPVKVTWESALSDITQVSADDAKNALTVATSDGKSMTIKKVPSDDHPVILRHLNAAGGVTIPVVAAAEAKKAKAEAAADEAAQAGNLVMQKSFGITAIAIYDGGYVRVSKAFGELASLWPTAPYEKLRSIKYGERVQDRGSVKPAYRLPGASKQQRSLDLTIATDRKVHTLTTEKEVLSSDDKSGRALEAAGQAVLDALASSTAAAPAASQPDPRTS